MILLLRTPESATALEGVAVAQPSAQGALTTEIRLAVDVAAAVSAQGALTTGIPLAADVAAAASAQVELSTAIQLASQAQAQAAEAGDLTTAIRLEAAVADAASALGALTTAIELATEAQAQGLASGDLTVGDAEQPRTYSTPQLIRLPWRLRDARDDEYDRELRALIERRVGLETKEPDLERLLDEAAEAGRDEDEELAIVLLLAA